MLKFKFTVLINGLKRVLCRDALHELEKYAFPRLRPDNSFGVCIRHKQRGFKDALIL